uniref:Large ribosomal subunit protein uL4 n=1 Tax=uncultured delta proteobacterium Rifle_16ft_4_minimus_11275 TaxID=1665173 RepID=A0A0H4T048_9DELT|nr:50S ribosomal protein L4, large subunit ribosomal protein L4 [uncultured delta proteobacterium Rifle_16ft_4_minimus_11275]
MNIEVLDRNGSKVSEIALKDEIFGGEVKEHLFYEVVKMQRANKRAGTASTKTKGNVSGGGIKPWKQKGTGRARSGSTRSPIWRHGGTVFGPHPRDYSYKLPKKVMKDALRNALALRLVIEGENRNLELAVRNLKDFQVQRTGGLNVYDILNYESLVMTRSALEKVEAMVQ